MLNDVVENIETTQNVVENIETTQDVVENIETTQSNEIDTEGVTRESLLQDLKDGYVLYDGKHYSKHALQEIKPELFIAQPDIQSNNTNFGVKFPTTANKGDIFVRVDVLPNRVFKFSDNRWIEINKETTQSYLYDQEYIKYLVNKISLGEYDVGLLTDSEHNKIEEFLKNQKT